MSWLKHFPDGWLENLQSVAMWESVVGSDDGFLRSVFRWYSKEFHTPLHLVDQIPIEDVLVHYFESHYDEMTDQQREAEVKRLLMTPEQLKEAKLTEDAQDADAVEISKMEPEAKDVEVQVDPVLERLKAIREGVGAAPEAALPNLPDFNVSFDDFPDDEMP